MINDSDYENLYEDYIKLKEEHDCCLRIGSATIAEVIRQRDKLLLEKTEREKLIERQPTGMACTADFGQTLKQLREDKNNGHRQ